MSGTKRLDWGKLLSSERLPREGADRPGSVPDPQPSQPAGVEPDDHSWLVESRTETERDFDRILFSAPTRRLGDKTQVFPLEKNESVRNRLTHSHEVSALARSIGTHLVHSELGKTIASEAAQVGSGFSAEAAARAIPAILGAVGLAHDIGNPPFGHQGEAAIRSWIARNQETLFRASSPTSKSGASPLPSSSYLLDNSQQRDFLLFEGNAQTLRTLTRLQVVKDKRGLNLTFGTLTALMKYTVGSDQVRKDGASHHKKLGYYKSEAKLVSHIRERVGLNDTLARHPLTYIMEACDDIAYSVVDAEDSIKKQIVSFHDLVAWLDGKGDLADDATWRWVKMHTLDELKAARRASLSPNEVNDVSMQLFRARAITALVSDTINTFQSNYDAIMTTGIDRSLLQIGRSNRFVDALKAFDREHAYKHRRVLELELDGFNTISKLMDMLWRGITDRERFDQPASSRNTPFTRYAYSRISENYRRVFEDASNLPHSEALPIRYRELQLLTDMIAGMTDQFAIDLCTELEQFNVGASSFT